MTLSLKHGEVTVNLRRGLWRNGGKESLQGGAPRGGEERKSRALWQGPEDVYVLTPAPVHRQVTQTTATSVNDGCPRNQVADGEVFWIVQAGPCDHRLLTGGSIGREHRREGRRDRPGCQLLALGTEEGRGPGCSGVALRGLGRNEDADTLVSASGNPLWVVN